MARPPKNQPVDLAKRQPLTVGLIERLTCRTDVKAQVFLRDSEAPGLRVRATNTGDKSFVFEGKLHRSTIRMTIGDVKAWTIEQARAEARRLAVMIDAKQDPREVNNAQREAKVQAAQAKKRAAEFTFGALMTDYCDQLERLGRSSHSKVRGMMNLHLVNGAPMLANKPAAQVTGEEVTDLMRRLHDDGKVRTAGKLRSYMRAAFEMARTARMDSTLPVRFKDYGVSHNPAAETKAIQRQTDKNPLTVQELRQYWASIKDVQSFEAAVLRAHLLTGGQRLEQFCRVRAVDVSTSVMVLRDPKGRPGRPPREHPLPITPAIRTALEQVKAWAPTGHKSRIQTASVPGTYLISKDGGQTYVSADAMSKWAKAAGLRASIEGFTAKRIRSGVETTLASLRISQEVRGHLLSHGVSGVQAASYDGHHYLDVKLEALETLHRHLENTSATVTHAVFAKAAA